MNAGPVGDPFRLGPALPRRSLDVRPGRFGSLSDDTLRRVGRWLVGAAQPSRALAGGYGIRAPAHGAVYASARAANFDLDPAIRLQAGLQRLGGLLTFACT